MGEIENLGRKAIQSEVVLQIVNLKEVRVSQGIVTEGPKLRSCLLRNRFGLSSIVLHRFGPPVSRSYIALFCPFR